MSNRIVVVNDVCCFRLVRNPSPAPMRTLITTLVLNYLDSTSNGQAYFTLIPLKYGLPALGVLFIIYQIRSQMIARTSKK